MVEPPIPQGLDPEAWRRLARADGERWRIDERDASGEIIGTAIRWPNGAKSGEPGGRRGLILPWPLSNYAGSSDGDPVLVAEGATDTAALMGLGFSAVGVPMAGHCGEMLAELLAHRHAVLMADADKAGRCGAARISAALVRRCASVRITMPPKGAKDAREAIIAGAQREDFDRAIREACAVDQDSIQTRSSGERERGRIEWQPVPLDELGPSEPVNWLWPGYVARGHKTLLTGLWKAGKSTLIAWLLHDLRFGGGLVPEPIEAPVLIVSEESASLWTERRDRLELDGQVRLVRQPFLGRPTPAQWEGFVGFLVDLVQRDGLAMVAFDTVATFWPIADENDASGMLSALMPLNAIAEAGCALLLVHHPRKGEAGEGQASRGSGALPGWVDVIVEFGRFAPEERDDRRRVLRAYSRLEGTPSESVVELTERGYRVIGAKADARRADRQDTISSILSGTQGPMTADEILAAWPDDNRPGKSALVGDLNDGVERLGWLRTGKGRKSDPYRFRRTQENNVAV